MRGIAATLLRKRGYEVLEAADGEQALILAEEHAGLIDIEKNSVKNIETRAANES